MAAKRVMVEINLAIDDLVLGITGKQRLFSLYRKFGVPMTLSTDDEGVSRIDLTHEYVRAVETYVLGYTDLQELVRNSLEYGFLPRASLWAGTPASPKPARMMPLGQRGRPQPVRPSLRGGFRFFQAGDGAAAFDRNAALLTW